MALRNWKVKQDSPDGALWLLGDTKTHTPDCVQMANKIWPWSVLDSFQPPVHPRCACSLVPLGMAFKKGLAKRGDMRPEAQAKADFIQSMRGLGLQEGRWVDRWPAGTENAGRFRPRLGGDPGRAVLHRLRGRRMHLNGQEREIHRDEGFSERIGGQHFTSPVGTTNVYQDGMLQPGTLNPEHVRHAANIVRAHVQEEQIRRGGAPLRPGDLPEHVLNMRDLGYSPTGMWSFGSGKWKMMFRHHDSGATAEAVVTKDGVESADHDTVPIPAQKARALLGPPKSFADLVGDAHAWSEDLGRHYHQPVHLGDIKPDKAFEDHAGFREWDGTVHLGRDVRPDIEKAATARAQGRPLSNREKQGVYASYWALAHEVAHSVNPMEPSAYHDEDAGLEEALAEELSHPLARERLLAQGQGDVVGWAEQHRLAAPVVGTYLRQRGALASILDAANIPQTQRYKLLVDLKFKTRPGDRFAVLGALLKRANPDLSQADAEKQARGEMAKGGKPRIVLGARNPGLPKKYRKFKQKQAQQELAKAPLQPWKAPPVTIGGGSVSAEQGPIPDFNDHTFVLSASKIIGSTAQKAKDENGERWVIQQHDGDANQVATELLANSIYRKLGIAAPQGGTVATPGAPDFSQIPDAQIDEPPLPATPRLSSGVILRDKRGRVTIIEPRNHFGGYTRTFAKGGVEKGLTPQQNALKELWEETGLHAHITGVLGDYQGDTGVSRYYVGALTGGKITPSAETAAIETVKPEEAAKLLNRQRDQEILGDLLQTPIPQGKYPDNFPPVVPGVAAAYKAIPGVKDYKAKGEDPDLANGYMADALVGNWAPVGGKWADNLRRDEQGHVIRLNPSATFEYSPRGHPKPFGPVPTEAWSLMHKGELAGIVHPGEAQLHQQAQQITDALPDDEIDKLVNAAPFRDQKMRERVRENLKARREWMERYADGTAGLPEPPSGEAARQIHRARQSDFEIYPEEAQALDEYADNPEAVDGYIAAGKGSPSPDVERITGHLDHVLNDIDTGDDTYAFVPLHGDSPTVGDTVKMPGYPRLMTDENLAALRSAKLMKVLVPKHAHAYFDERENDPNDLLLPRNARFKVVSHREQDGRSYVDAVLQPYHRPGPLYTKPWVSKPYEASKPKIKPGHWSDAFPQTTAGSAWGNQGHEGAWRVNDVIRYGSTSMHGVVKRADYKEGKLAYAEVTLDSGNVIKANTPEKLAKLHEPDAISDEDWGDGLHDDEDHLKEWAEEDDELDEAWDEEKIAAERRGHEELPELPWHEPPHPTGKAHERKGGGMTAVGVTNTKLGDTVENALQAHFGMANEHPDRRQGPLDVRIGQHGYEVKAVSQAASEYKAKPKHNEIEGKKQYAAEHGLKPHTMIVVYEPGARQMHVYSKEGIGAYRLTDEAHGWHYHGSFPIDLGDHPDPVAHGEVQEAVVIDWVLGIVEAEQQHTGAMVALYPDESTAADLANPDGTEGPKDLHVTLAFLGDADDLDDPDGLAQQVSDWAANTPPLSGAVSGTGQFLVGDDAPVTYLSPDIPGLPAARQDLVDRLKKHKHPVSERHGFSPHMTTDYGNSAEQMSQHAGKKLTFAKASLVIGGKRTDFPFTGKLQENWDKWNAEHGKQELGVTPFRGAGHARGSDYYDTSRYKGFEGDVKSEAQHEGVQLLGIDRVRGIWNGGGEPSARVRLRDGVDAVNRIADHLGEKYNQDGVLRFRHGPGAGGRYITEQPVDRGDLEDAISHTNLPGATHLPDGRAEIIDLDGSLAGEVKKLHEHLGANFVYHPGGEGELRENHVHYGLGEASVEGSSWVPACYPGGTRVRRDESPDVSRRPDLGSVEEHDVTSELRDTSGKWVAPYGHSDVYPGSADAKAFDSAWKEISDLGVDVHKPDLAYTYMTPKDAKAYADTLQSAFKQYPVLKDSKYRPLKDLWFDSSPGLAPDARSPEGVVASYGETPDATTPGRMVINDMNPDGQEQVAQSAHDGNTSLATEKPEGVVWHELGHALMAATGNSGVVEQDGKVGSVPRGVQASATVDWLEKYGIKQPDVTKLSRYGAASPMEALGELSAMWNTPGYRDKLAPALQEKVGKLFDDLRSGKATGAVTGLLNDAVPDAHLGVRLDVSPETLAKVRQAAAINDAAGAWVVLPGGDEISLQENWAAYDEKRKQLHARREELDRKYHREHPFDRPRDVKRKLAHGEKPELEAEHGAAEKTLHAIWQSKPANWTRQEWARLHIAAACLRSKEVPFETKLAIAVAAAATLADSAAKYITSPAEVLSGKLDDHLLEKMYDEYKLTGRVPKGEASPGTGKHHWVANVLRVIQVFTPFTLGPIDPVIGPLLDEAADWADQKDPHIHPALGEGIQAITRANTDPVNRETIRRIERSVRKHHERQQGYSYVHSLDAQITKGTVGLRTDLKRGL
jgi:8-oxo-dGTP pyrophosphatase MutT (NUDIX family)/2'-5' RNA ligase